MSLISTRCGACKSPLRNDIDEKLRAGASVRELSKWLATKGEKISNSALDRHRSSHLIVHEEIVNGMIAMEQAFDGPVQSAISRIVALRANYMLMAKLRDQSAKRLMEQLDAGTRVSMPLVTLLNGAASEVRKSIQAVQRALGETADAKSDEGPDPTVIHIIANQDLVERAHELLAHVRIDGNAGGDGVSP